MKKLRFLFLMSLIHLIFFPVDDADAKKGTQVVITDTVKDPHSRYTAIYESVHLTHCSAILISSTVALTAKHCGGDYYSSFNGSIYPGESGLSTPFGYMNIRVYIPHSLYDIAILKGTEQDQSRAYHYYMKGFKTPVTALSNDELQDMVGRDVYSYGYPYKFSGYKQYRSDGDIKHYYLHDFFLYTSMPTHEGQSGAGAFLKNGRFIGIIITRNQHFEGNILPFNKEIADWVNQHAN
ncbi:trypsin-like serine peptidase [Staphylococcus delphini]|uniref:trypsin-like serine peptidase n=1 Tax=Staphylococcus delphini TaxID=53344 RepID=UPI0021D35693|nr:trypsin-like peptidase domain-containing protein [Staphylococcus delphini]UXS21414.1 trypsin-like serine protease [Staphylococcus delphini]UXS57364.1 trypsin-like serine protease [Staphylococcus delphini]